MKIEFSSLKKPDSTHTIDDSLMIVSDEENSNSSTKLHAQVHKLTGLVEKLCLQNASIICRMAEMEKIVEGYSNVPHDKGTEKIGPRVGVESKFRNSQTATPVKVNQKKKKASPVSKITRFLKGENNRKGGVFSYDDGQRVYITDKDKCGNAIDEILNYVRIKFDEETYSQNKKGRLKLKGNVREIIESIDNNV